MKSRRLSKQHFINWEISDLTEYVEYLAEQKQTQGIELTLSLASEVLSEKVNQLN